MTETAPKNNNVEDKAQVSLLPMDLLIPLLEPAYREGLIKYKRESWRKGFQSTVMYDALMRHLTAWFFHLESYDPEAKEKFDIEKHHLGAVIFCAICLYQTEKYFPNLDDRLGNKFSVIDESENKPKLTLADLNWADYWKSQSKKESKDENN